MLCMSDGAAAFSGKIESWDVPWVKEFRQMFLETKSFNQDIGGVPSGTLKDTQSFLQSTAQALDSDTDIKVLHQHKADAPEFSIQSLVSV
mmetsp:Transcript_32719/g.79317  ORF Transcript_32719/g.79317 Transcript_32719/m.79317 type:complete len:90 (+) Transcript_32719:554-823(+)